MKENDRVERTREILYKWCVLMLILHNIYRQPTGDEHEFYKSKICKRDRVY
jgi:hypothetical protein